MTMMTRYEPFGNVLSLREAMDRLFEDSFVAPFGRLMQTTSIMPVDVYETEDAFVVNAFMPGLTPDDLDITVQQQVVTIHGEPKADDLNGLRPLVQERPTGQFTRTFSLPVPVDANRVGAEFRNGVLHLTLPKLETARPHKIEIKAE
ncbi:MAG TPA: Hsp20/alpha crystallin family protein [Herpetosiphonaceae bacterium]|nr:Hsp20/alpha crystallin family protein [Herpetosiphonaceae bacterium]